MKKFLILFLTLALILGVFSSCTPKRYLVIDDETSKSTEQETTESSQTNQTEETTTEDTAEETWHNIEPLGKSFDSYEDFEKALSGEDDEGARNLQILCLEIPETEKLLNIIKQHGSARMPLINGELMPITSFSVYSLYHPFGPFIEYRRVYPDNLLIDVAIHYLDEMYNRDFSIFETPKDIKNELHDDFDADDWLDITINIDGATVSAIELKNPTSANIRKIEYYYDGLYITVFVNDPNLLTDEFWQGFSIE